MGRSNEAEIVDGVEVAVLGCLPVTPNETEREIMAATGLRIDVPYDGSIQSTCKGCGRGIWVGPRQQALLAERPNSVHTMCLPCAVTMLAEHDGTIDDVHHLGGTHPLNG